MPMDWNATQPWNGDLVSLAIIRLPAKVNIEDPRYGGPLFIVAGMALAWSYVTLTKAYRRTWWLRR